MRVLIALLLATFVGGCVHNRKPVLNRLISNHGSVSGESQPQTFPSQILAGDLIPGYTNSDGESVKWQVVQDVQPTIFRMKDVEFVPFVMPIEQPIFPEEMCRRAISAHAALGLVDGKYLLEHEEEIPAPLKNATIPLPGTVLLSPDGQRYSPCLVYTGGDWDLRFYHVSDDDYLWGVWDEDDRLVRRKWN